MQLDAFIFDSQFAFLNENEALAAAYEAQVLANAERRFFGKSTGYVRQEIWDSEKVGKNIGRLLWLEDVVVTSQTIDEVIKGLSDFNCCYVRLNAAHRFCNHASNTNLQLLSSKISQHLNLMSCEPVGDENLTYHEYSTEPANREDSLRQVLALAEKLFNHGRFREDRRFSRQLTDEIYRSWVTSELVGTESSLYYVTESGNVVAFLLYRRNISPLSWHTIGFITLIATAPQHKKRRYASNLLNFVLQHAKRDGTHYVIANTERKNSEAIRFFSKHGFNSTAILNEYHVWNDICGTAPLDDEQVH